MNRAIIAGLLAVTGCVNTQPSNGNSSGNMNSAVYRITRLIPAGWEVAERESNVVPRGLLNSDGGQYLVLRGPRDRTTLAGPFRPSGLPVSREELQVWIMPQPFHPKRPGLVQLLQLAPVPTPPSFSAANEKIRVYAEESGISSWRHWPQDLIGGLHLQPDRP